MNMPPINQFKRFDVREMLSRGVEPFPEIRKRVDALKPDEGLIVIAPFLPSPPDRETKQRRLSIQT